MFFSKKNLLVSFSLLVVAGGFSLYLGLSKPVEATEDEEGWVTVAEALATQSDPVPPSVSHVSHVRPATHQTTHVAPTHASSRTQVGGVRQASAASKLIAAPAEEEVSRELPRIETVEEYVNDSRPAAPMGLPNAAGQIWREYDIRPYTTSQRLVAAPEERVRDWILRETGETTWHGADLAILSVTPHKVRVYHTPQMQSRISQVIDRLVAKDRGVDFICRVVTVSNPRWRAVARPQMRVLPTQPNSPICVWSLPRKNYGQFILGLEKFAGYREFVSPNQKFSSGEKVTFALATTREYVKDVRPMRDFIAEVPASVEDGLTLSLEPLLTKDGKMCHLALDAKVQNLEKMHNVELNIPKRSPEGTGAIKTIGVPLLSEAQAEGVFCWPTDEILVVSLGTAKCPTTLINGSKVSGIAEILVLVQRANGRRP